MTDAKKIRLLIQFATESLDSYERNGLRTIDKAIVDVYALGMESIALYADLKVEDRKGDRDHDGV
jgi:hypothetical protein